MFTLPYTLQAAELPDPDLPTYLDNAEPDIDEDTIFGKVLSWLWDIVTNISVRGTLS